MAAVAFLLVAGIYSFAVIFSKFGIHDDEAFLMITLQGYLSGHSLYDSVFTMYGPVYYFYGWCVHTCAALPVNHDVTGVLCMVHWLSAAVILALASFRLTRALWLGFFVFMQAVLHLSNMSNEPGHPQELIVLLLALAAFVASGDLRKRLGPILLAVTGVALIFIKINVGAYYAIALCLFHACYNPPFRLHRALYGCLLAGCALLPFLLMRSRLSDPLTLDYAWRSLVSILTTGAVAYGFGAKRVDDGRRWLDISSAGVAAAAVILGILLLTGTSLRAMLDCLVVVPGKMASQPSGFPVGGALHSAWPASVSVAAAFMVLGARKRLERAPFVMAALKGIYGLLGTWVLVTKLTFQFDFLLPWIWLAMLPTKGQTTATASPCARGFICIIAAWQGLQAYPVAGTQVAIATFLPVLVYSLCLNDAIVAITVAAPVRQYLSQVSLRTSALCRAFCFTGLLYVFVADWCQPVAWWRYYASGTPLKLRGASLLRLPPWQVEQYSTLTRYLRAECDTFFTVPGFNSLYFWAGIEPPNYFNVCIRVLQGTREQDEIVAALRTAKRPLIVMNEKRVVASDSAVLGDGPLATFITQECQPVTRLAGCRILRPTASGAQ